MSKNLSPIWFLKDPIDPEHKEYILLGYLKSISKDLNQSNCFSIARGISRIVKPLNDYKKDQKISESVIDLLKKEDREFAKEFSNKKLSDEEVKGINEIVENSLETLYGYSGICLEMIKEEESKIKIFKIQSKFDPPIKKEDSGILIVRNMATDKLLNYFFRSSVTMKTKEGDREVFILKKAPIKNQFFSLNYEYIYHEILSESKLDGEYFPHLYVIEIYENFEEESEIYKLAKEKFIEVLSKK